VVDSVRVYKELNITLEQLECSDLALRSVTNSSDRGCSSDRPALTLGVLALPRALACCVARVGWCPARC
jgi:hypothetical protein